MIKDPTEQQLKHMKVNLTLKDGREFLGCDTTNTMSCPRAISIWQGESVLVFPLRQVVEIAYYFEEGNP